MEKTLVGKLLTAEAKKPGKDIVDVAIEVHALVVLPSERGEREYLFGIDGEGRVGLYATRFLFADTVKAVKSKGFVPQTLEGWYVVPPASNPQGEEHWAWAEKLSERAIARLPQTALKLADYVVA